MDIIFLHDLIVSTTIGVFDWEKKIKQKLKINLDFNFDFTEAAKTDDVSKTLDYAKLAEAVHHFAATTSYQLLECYAENLAKSLQAQFKIPWIKITICKPGILPNAGAVGVSIERSQEQNNN